MKYKQNMFNIITDIKTTGSLKMFRLHLTNKYHIIFMKNTSLFNGKKGISITLMKTTHEKGRYAPVFNRKYN